MPNLARALRCIDAASWPGHARRQILSCIAYAGTLATEAAIQQAVDEINARLRLVVDAAADGRAVEIEAFSAVEAQQARAVEGVPVERDQYMIDLIRRRWGEKAEPYRQALEALGAPADDARETLERVASWLDCDPTEVDLADAIESLSDRANTATEQRYQLAHALQEGPQTEWPLLLEAVGQQGALLAEAQLEIHRLTGKLAALREGR